MMNNAFDLIICVSALGLGAQVEFHVMVMRDSFAAGTSGRCGRQDRGGQVAKKLNTHLHRHILRREIVGLHLFLLA